MLGAGGHAKVVIATAREAGWTVAAVYDDERGRWGDKVLGAPVRGPLAAALEEPRTAVLALGDNRLRARLAGELALDWATLVHPGAIVHASARLAPGAVVFAGAVVQPDCAIGAHAIVNTASSLDHDCRLGDFAHLAPGGRLAGHVTVGAGSLVGIGCAVAPGVAIGDWSTVGAGSAVLRDVAAGATVAGSPAAPLRPR